MSASWYTALKAHTKTRMNQIPPNNNVLLKDPHLFCLKPSTAQRRMLFIQNHKQAQSRKRLFEPSPKALSQGSKEEWAAIQLLKLFKKVK